MIYYCVTNRLPIITVLVVRANNRKLSDEAIANIYAECKELSVDVGLDPKVFVDNQVKLSRSVVVEGRPNDAL